MKNEYDYKAEPYRSQCIEDDQKFYAKLCYKCGNSFRYEYHELCKNCIEGNKHRD